MEAELKKKYCYVIRQVIELYLALCEQCQLKKDDETGITCKSNPFTLHEFSVPGTLD